MTTTIDDNNKTKKLPKAGEIWYWESEIEDNWWAVLLVLANDPKELTFAAMELTGDEGGYAGDIEYAWDSTIDQFMRLA